MSPELHVRVDNRLLHGQVVQFWIPHLEVGLLLIADDQAARDTSLHTVYRAALPERVELAITPVAEAAEAVGAADAAVILVLVSDVADAVRARESGLEFPRLTLGNVHASADRSRVTDAVHLGSSELASVSQIRRAGIAVEIQTFPGETLRLELDAEGAPFWSKR